MIEMRKFRLVVIWGIDCKLKKNVRLIKCGYIILVFLSIELINYKIIICVY